MNESFLFKSIRKYNRARRQTQRDCILHAVGVHTGLIEKQRSPLPILSTAERSRVIYFVNQFLKTQGFKIFVE